MDFDQISKVVSFNNHNNWGFFLNYWSQMIGQKKQVVNNNSFLVFNPFVGSTKLIINFLISYWQPSITTICCWDLTKISCPFFFFIKIPKRISNLRSKSNMDQIYNIEKIESPIPILLKLLITVRFLFRKTK